MRISFFVHGKPQPGGSKRGFPIRRKDGTIGVAMSDANPKVHDWRRVVADKAREVYKGPLLDCPLSIRVDFVLVRPKKHYTASGRALKANAPKYPTVKPDTTKLFRALEDSLKDVLWRDDSLIVRQVVNKDYGPSFGAWVMVETL